MKKLIFLIIMLFLFNTLIVREAKAIYVSNEFIVKFKEHKVPNRTVSKKDYIETGLTSLDMLNSKYQISSMKKLVEKTNLHGLKYGLDRIHLLKSSAKIDVHKAIEEFKNNPIVEYAEPNYIRIIFSTFPNDACFDLLWGLHNIGQGDEDCFIQYYQQPSGIVDADIDAPEAWDITTGSSDVVVAVIDTGLDYNHPDIVSNVWVNPGEISDNEIDDDNNEYIDDIHGWDFTTCAEWDIDWKEMTAECIEEKPEDDDPYDDHYHGSHVSGTIGAIGNNGPDDYMKSLVGVNWVVSIMPLKAFNRQGVGQDSDIINALNYAIMMDVPITSNSYGDYNFSNSFYDAVKAAEEANSLFVAAAGNGLPLEGIGLDTDIYPHYPSSYNLSNIISVAATNKTDDLATFSNYGMTSVDLGAPGQRIWSITQAIYAHHPASGTSMATPHVSGVAALIKSVYPTLTATKIKERILNSVDVIPALQGKTVSEGRLNAYKALIFDTITTNISVSEDSWVKEYYPDTNYGSEPVFTVGVFRSDRNRIWLKYDLSSLPSEIDIINAKIWLWGTAFVVGAENDRIAVALSSNDSWSESIITWNNQPTYESTLTKSVVEAEDHWESWIVTSAVENEYVGDKTVTFVLYEEPETIEEPNDLCLFNQKEADEIHDPYLEVIYKILYSCTDTDGGFYPKTKGTVSGYQDGEYYNYTDYCGGGTYINEYSCDGSSWQVESYDCGILGSGYYCSYIGKKCVQYIPPPGGGCPILKVWNGNEFVEIEKLDIHAPEYQDKTVTTSFTMKPIDGRYEIILDEAAYIPLDGSHINYVSLKDESGKECELISAIHSKHGDVLLELIKSDDVRIQTFPSENIKLVYTCSGNRFSFTIEGYNPLRPPLKTPYFTLPYLLEVVIPFVSIVLIAIEIIVIALIIGKLKKITLKF